MLRRLTAGALVLAVAALPACTSEDGDDSGRFPVSLLAGGGQEEPSESPVAGEDALFSGPLTSLAAGTDGTVYAVLDATSIVRVDESGGVSAWSPALPDGATEIVDLAPAPDGTVYMLLRGTPNEPLGWSTVYRWDGTGDVEPAFGVDAPDGTDRMPASPDGTDAADAALGRISDIAVDGTGRVLFVEEIAGAGYEVANLVRVVEDGALRTVAGKPPEDADQITDGVVHGSAFPDDGAAATDVPILGPVLVGAGEDEVVVQMTRSVLAVEEDGTLRPVLGAPDGTPTVPRISADGPLTDPLSPLAVEYGSNLRHLGSPSVSSDGGVLATTFGGLPSEDETAERHRWDVVDGSDRAQAIADAAAGGEDEDLAGVYVAPDGQVVTASLFGNATTLLGNGTVVVAAQDPESGESILVTFAATVRESEG
ncbi:hypothetical protein G1H11_13485 [Phytoactinopolyspora alkaliphila]|uniref:PQQ-binding-like beta-propeller repeat protein n=1 Tax=Phytoactinopolyspora alkaliphila TaxID=1783498 RepID=A0A6N9YMN9_9ACTN|nr:hypothetical protein [Phytoactinopolyspora alkaliphila]NED96321.1 hypothetical protein [Phytoactinopolyspora alkaliphila]